ncbi:MAG: gamma carbonic anhydrase family protein [Planctomycetia bacterium]|nr:gamma carbonic anhydrase family protein [Planctomycetia bacterium]
MIVYITQGRLPMDDHFYVADDAVITGDVTIGKNVTIWFQTIIRGDVAPIRIGQGTNIQDSSMVHCEYQCEQVIEENIVIGHKAILHGKQVGAGTLIGMGAILLSGSIIGEECIIAATQQEYFASLHRVGAKICPRAIPMERPKPSNDRLSCEGYLKSTSLHL